jgi:hypothetical protein
VWQAGALPRCSGSAGGARAAGQCPEHALQGSLAPAAACAAAPLPPPPTPSLTPTRPPAPPAVLTLQRAVALRVAPAPRRAGRVRTLCAGRRAVGGLRNPHKGQHHSLLQLGRAGVLLNPRRRDQRGADDAHHARRGLLPHIRGRARARVCAQRADRRRRCRRLVLPMRCARRRGREGVIQGSCLRRRLQRRQRPLGMAAAAAVCRSGSSKPQQWRQARPAAATAHRLTADHCPSLLQSLHACAQPTRRPAATTSTPYSTWGSTQLCSWSTLRLCSC